jgi:hypothetical protein
LGRSAQAADRIPGSWSSTGGQEIGYAIASAVTVLVLLAQLAQARQ